MGQVMVKLIGRNIKCFKGTGMCMCVRLLRNTCAPVETHYCLYSGGAMQHGSMSQMWGILVQVWQERMRIQVYNGVHYGSVNEHRRWTLTAHKANDCTHSFFSYLSEWNIFANYNCECVQRRDMRVCNFCIRAYLFRCALLSTLLAAVPSCLTCFLVRRTTCLNVKTKHSASKIPAEFCYASGPWGLCLPLLRRE